jgi:hypothetical protein
MQGRWQLGSNSGTSFMGSAFPQIVFDLPRRSGHLERSLDPRNKNGLLEPICRPRENPNTRAPVQRELAASLVNDDDNLVSGTWSQTILKPVRKDHLRAAGMYGS